MTLLVEMIDRRNFLGPVTSWSAAARRIPMHPDLRQALEKLASKIEQSIVRSTSWQLEARCRVGG
jgi:hypothetical protein